MQWASAVRAFPHVRHTVRGLGPAHGGVWFKWDWIRGAVWVVRVGNLRKLGIWGSFPASQCQLLCPPCFPKSREDVPGCQQAGAQQCSPGTPELPGQAQAAPLGDVAPACSCPEGHCARLGSVPGSARLQGGRCALTSWEICPGGGLDPQSSLSPEQTQESIERFEQQAGLRDAGYTPHKGLTTEENKHLRVAEALQVSLPPPGMLRRQHLPQLSWLLLWRALAGEPRTGGALSMLAFP